MDESQRYDSRRDILGSDDLYCSMATFRISMSSDTEDGGGEVHLTVCSAFSRGRHHSLERQAFRAPRVTCVV
jgi:hypothetical protein